MKLPLCLLACAACLPVPALAQSAADLGAQAAQLMQWWPGEYDNHEQIVRQSGGGLSEPTDAPFFRLHTVVRLASAPSLGDRVLYVTEYRNDDPHDVIRSRVYVVRPDENAKALRISQFEPAHPLENSAPIDAAALKPIGPACDLLLRFVGGQFEGGTAPQSCPGKHGFSEYGLVVGPRYTWVRDREMDRAGNVAWEMATGSGYGWFEQSRARLFTCTVHENPDGDMAKTKYLTTIHLHDQGGAADIAWPDGRTLTFTIHTRAFSSPPDREYPLFRIHEKGKTVPIAYAYAVDGASRFGLNLGWFYVRCYAEGDWDTVEDKMRGSRR